MAWESACGLDSDRSHRVGCAAALQHYFKRGHSSSPPLARLPASKEKVLCRKRYTGPMGMLETFSAVVTGGEHGAPQGPQHGSLPRSATPLRVLQKPPTAAPQFPLQFSMQALREQGSAVTQVPPNRNTRGDGGSLVSPLFLRPFLASPVPNFFQSPSLERRVFFSALTHTPPPLRNSATGQLQIRLLLDELI